MAQSTSATAQIERAPAADPFTDFIVEASQRSGIPAQWIRAVIAVESGGDPHAISAKGAMGLMQIMPSTWEAWRDRLALGTDPFDPRANILAGTAFLRQMFGRYGTPGFLAAYNAGPARYDDHLATGRPLPAETRTYVTMLAPMLSDKPVDGPVLPLTGKSWATAPLFIDRRTDTTPAPSTSRRMTDVSAITPRSDGLFVRLVPLDRQP